MTAPSKLRGMAWDHPRAVNPLKAISAQWANNNNISVDWDARPLKDFEDQPLEELANTYDLVLIDYPFVGTAAASGLIVPVNDWVDADYLEDQKINSVGPSFASYTWDGRQWALAVDAACQISAVRDDLLSGSDLSELPRTWEEVVALAEKLHSTPGNVAIALNPNHAYCAFLSIGLTISGEQFWPTGKTVDHDAGREALAMLKRLSGCIHPASRNVDPIAVSDLMSTTDEVIYVPLMFGYSSYARDGFRKNPLKFTDAPQGANGEYGSVLGGVGIALSARSEHREAAADLARLIASPEIQSGVYTDSGGQPGHAAAWESESVNKQTGNFFTATRETINHAFLRPRVPGHRRFQELAGELIHRFTWTETITADQCLKDYDELVESLLGKWELKV